MKKICALLGAVAILFGAAVPTQAKDYNRIGVTYEGEMVDGDGHDFNLNGFGLGYIHGFGLSNRVPVYLETGLKFATGWGTKHDVDYTLLNLQIPLNVAYRVQLPRHAMSLVPYAGFNFKFNCYYNGEYKGHDYNLFDDPYDANVFQLGWHIGLGFNYSAFYAGMSFGIDFMRLAHGQHTMTFNIGVGYNF